jgi:putative chitinase
MIPVSLDHLRPLAPRAHLVYLKALAHADAVLTRYDVNTNALRLAHFFAQILHESGAFTVFEESLTYRSAERIRAVFGSKRFPTLASAARYVNNPIELARKVYNGRMGNTVTNDDGFRYRGRGPLQLTGRDNYVKFGSIIGVDLAAKPELVNHPEYLFAIPAAYWKVRGCNEAADADDVVRVTKLVNGGTIGLDDRKAWLARTKAVWS